MLLKVYFEPNSKNFKPNVSRAIKKLSFTIKNWPLGEYFNAFDDSVLGLHDFERVIADSKTGASLGNIFKMFYY